MLVPNGRLTGDVV